MKVDNIKTTSFEKKPVDNTGISLNGNDTVNSLSSPFINPYSKTIAPNISSSSLKGKTAAERNNNPFNIKYGKFAATYGATKENKPALDGGSFATFPTVEAGMTAAKDLLKGKGYRNLTVDQAMKRWSNNGYGGNLYPEVANKKVSDLSDIELDNLQKKQIVREDRQYAKKLGYFKYGGRIPTYNVGGLTPNPYQTNLQQGLNNYVTPNALNTLIKNNTRPVEAPKTTSGSGLSTGMLTMGLGLAGSALETLDRNPNKVNKPVSVGAGALKGAATGAAMGSVIPGWGTAVGAAAGAVVGGVTSLVKANKKQRAINKNIADDQRNYNQMAQNRSANLYAQLNPYQYKFGGDIIPEYEVEKGEIVQGNAILEDGKQLANGLHLVKGKKHEQGGTLGSGGDRVFSDSIPFNKNKTIASKANLIANKIGKFEKNLSAKDYMKRKTAEVMTNKLTKELDNLFEIQEAAKTQMFKYGGNIPKFETGGTMDDERAKIQNRIKVIDRYLKDNPKRFATGNFDPKDKLRSERKQLQGQLDNPAIWTGKPWNPLEDSNPTPSTVEGGTFDAVNIKAKRTPTSTTKVRTKKLPSVVRNSYNGISPLREKGANFTNLLQNGALNRTNTETQSIVNNKPVQAAITNNSKTRNGINIDENLATGIGLSAMGYLNTAANINRMNTDAPVELTNSPYYQYRDRNRLAREGLQSSVNTVLQNPNVNPAQKQALFSKYSQGLNEINNQENSNRFAYDNDFAAREMMIAGRNNAMLTQSKQQRIANENAKLGLKSQNFNSFIGNVNTSLAERDRRNLDNRRMNLIASTYKRNYGTDFDIQP